ncbi:MAG TPA: DUF4336 domain-containing protein [Dongiaceae bacterium]|nr:DUF4336 domain-containing protein [Dongiaceae bacterium]
MSDTAFLPYAPLDVPKPVAPDVWIVDGPEIAFGWLGVKLPFPTRMTLVRLPDGGLWLHSPTQPGGALLERVAALGPIRFLVAPNSMHYWWVPDWKTRFPDAEVWCAPGLERSAKRALPPHRVLGDAAPAAWADAIDQVLVAGGVFSEVDFLHRASRTLILTDLIENFEPRRARSRWLRLLLRTSGAADPDGKAPFDMQLSFLFRRKDVRAAVQRMMAWQPQRVILAHGRWYEGNAGAELRRAFRWVA